MKEFIPTQFTGQGDHTQWERENHGHFIEDINGKGDITFALATEYDEDKHPVRNVIMIEASNDEDASQLHCFIDKNDAIAMRDYLTNIIDNYL